MILQTDADPLSGMSATAFIRWAGSKRLLLPTLIRLAPPKFNTYFEPFLGAGNLFLRLGPIKANLNDSLAPLVMSWIAVRDNPQRLLAEMDQWDCTPEQFAVIRAMSPTSDMVAAARFLYLNKNAYGGIYRLNRAGQFNVPWAPSKTQAPINRKNLEGVQALLRQPGVRLGCGDFADQTSLARSGDFVFFDPPYSKGRAERPFVHYNEKLFDWQAQSRLGAEAARLQRIGAHVVVTNSAHPDIADLYPTFKYLDVSRHSSLHARPTAGRALTERIFYTEELATSGII